MDCLKSPFRYAGGKYYARKIISEHLIESDCYCEPFAGGGSIFFYKEKSNMNILNDLDSDLMNAYSVIQNNVEEMIYIIKNIGKPTKEIHSFLKNEFKPANNIEAGARWFYLNRTSYNGIMKPVNMCYSYVEKNCMRYNNWEKALRRASYKLEGVVLQNKDALDCIHDLPDGCLVFVDAPYYNTKQDRFYNHVFDMKDHVKLAETIKEESNRLKFLISYDNCADIRDMYGFMKSICNEEWRYSMNRLDYKPENRRRYNNGDEIILKNY